jgi:hypothetical protein
VNAIKLNVAQQPSNRGNQIKPQNDKLYPSKEDL